MNRDSVNEDAFATGPTLECFQLFNVEDAEMLSNVMLALRDRIERREVGEEEMVSWPLGGRQAIYFKAFLLRRVLKNLI